MKGERWPSGVSDNIIYVYNVMIAMVVSYVTQCYGLLYIDDAMCVRFGYGLWVLYIAVKNKRLKLMFTNINPNNAYF